jgi:hypothetical protein
MHQQDLVAMIAAFAMILMPTPARTFYTAPALLDKRLSRTISAPFTSCSSTRVLHLHAYRHRVLGLYAAMGKDKDIRDSSMRNQGDLSEMSVDANNDGDGVQVRRLRPDSPVSGSLRLTRSDIDGSLACAEKNLATFRKQVRLSSGSFVFLFSTLLE